MQRASTFTGSVAGLLAAVASTSVLTAQQPYRPGRDSIPPKPALQCYAIWPDTGSSPPFLPEHLILGANPIGGIGFRAAGVYPIGVARALGTRTAPFYAQWRSYGRLGDPDSIWVRWSGGELYASVHGDSLSGRAVHTSDVLYRVVPWLQIHGRSEPCPPDH